MDYRDIEERLSTLEQHAVLRDELRWCDVPRAKMWWWEGPPWRRKPRTIRSVDGIPPEGAR
jgi:hypothetical protein